MELSPEIRAVVAAHRDEIEGDLARAKHELAQMGVRGAELEREVAGLEVLLASVRSEDGDRHPGDRLSGLTLHDAMVTILEGAPSQMMRAGDLASEIDRRGLYRMRDGRSVEAQQIHARVGHYPHLLTKSGTFIALASKEPGK